MKPTGCLNARSGRIPATLAGRILLVSSFWATGLFGSFSMIAAQTQNRAILEDLLISCLSELPSGSEEVMLDADESWPFLRSAVVNHWMQRGVRVFESDSAGASAIPRTRISYRIESGGTSYRSSEGNLLERSITLSENHRVIDVGGQVVADDRCSKSYSDSIRRDEIDIIETSDLPATVGAVPEARSFRKRILEPTILVASLATTIYLFFSVRSRASSQ